MTSSSKPESARGESLEEEMRRWIDHLGLRPHPEGGFYRELYRSGDNVSRRGQTRSALTTIHYLLAKGQVSRWHVVESDEVWHFLGGEAMELITHDPGSGETGVVRLGPPLTPGTETVRVVPAGHWQAARPLGKLVLAGCTVGPGFDFADFRFVSDLPGHNERFTGDLARYKELL